MTDWIDINERLPEDGKHVLLYIPADDTIRIGWHVHSAWGMRQEWAIISAMNSFQTMVMKPSHWCELPPKPGRSDI